MHTDIPMDRSEKKIFELETIEKLIDEQGGLAKTADIEALGIDYRRIITFVEEGKLRRVKNGYYTTTGSTYSEDQLIATMYPDGVLTMESALFAYGYLKKKPLGWSIAISKNTSKSRFKVEYPVVEPFYTEDDVLTLGVTELPFADGVMKIYTKDRLICDVIKYQEKMDREDFKEALRSYIDDDTKDVAELMSFAIERKVRKKVQMMIGIWL
ncbi:MAG: type IV toxin-antitoxin system AbiEi family antitoxin domain-containing protein [Lachnospiraceae bacterium]|nr:type IV toxin-antitoxin system AbiEi family antitoxin domain-containing protein [Lachnospiraceae bacterium]